MNIEELTERVQSKLFENAVSFFNETIKIYNEGIEKERSIVLISANLQICLELCIKHFVVKNYDLISILKMKNNVTSMVGLSEKEKQEITTGIENNTIKAKEFEQLKNFIKTNSYSAHAIIPFIDDIDRLQKYRNRLCHFVYFFSAQEKEDYIYVILNIIFRIVTFLMDSDRVGLEDCNESIFEYIDQDEYRKFIQDNRVYVELEDLLLDEFGDLLTCPFCEKQLMIPQKYCMSCFHILQSPIGFGYLDCPICDSKDTVLFDNLNFDCNESVPCLCLKCGFRHRVNKDHEYISKWW